MTDIIGNSALRANLEKMVEKGRVGNSLLFSGPEGVGKCLYARFLASKILGVGYAEGHPDFHYIRPEGKLSLHTIETMRWLSNEVHMPPYSSKKKVFIIENAHSMRPECANALLKTFEEPSLDTVIILVTHRSESMLSTILSRCRIIKFQPVAVDDICLFVKNKYSKDDVESRSIATRAAGSIGRAIKIAEGEDSERRDLLLRLLAGGKVQDYQVLKDKIKALVDLVDKDNVMPDLTDDNMTAIQKTALEKESQGIVASRFLGFTDALFDDILSWYRDLHLLQVGGDEKYLFYGDKREMLSHGVLRPLEEVSRAVSEAQLALRRSSKLNHCLEGLFLCLGFL
jgi:DNA polymerase III subunit delta'